MYCDVFWYSSALQSLYTALDGAVSPSLVPPFPSSLALFILRFLIVATLVLTVIAPQMGSANFNNFFSRFLSFFFDFLAEFA